MKKYRLTQAATRKSAEHFTRFRANKNDPGTTICLGCSGPVKRVHPSAQHGGPPITVTIQPATQEQWKALYEQGNPLIEEYDEKDLVHVSAKSEPPAAPKTDGK